jgi:predicted porin
MQLSKVFLGVAAALASTAALAQSSSVTFYGVMDLGIASNSFKTTNTSATGGVNVKSLTLDQGRSARWGMRGTEAIGGMNAIFNVEGGFDPDTGAAPVGAVTTYGSNAALIFNRRATVGLNGAFGEINLGYSLSPFDDVLGMSHHMGANSWENINNGVSGGAGFAKQQLFRNYFNNCDSTAFDARYGNSVGYETPNMGGFSVRTQYALLGENTTVGAKCFAWDTRVRGTVGPVTVGLAYAKHGNFTDFAPRAAAPAGLNLSHNDDALRAAAKMTFGMFEIDATAERANYKPVTGGKYTYTGMGFGAMATVGATKFGVQYNKRDNGLAYLYNVTAAGPSMVVPVTAFDNSATSHANWKQGGGSHVTIKADHSLSNRTRVYAYFSSMKNELNHYAAPNNQATVRNLVAGIWHSF